MNQASEIDELSRLDDPSADSVRVWCAIRTKSGDILSDLEGLVGLTRTIGPRFSRPIWNP